MSDSSEPVPLSKSRLQAARRLGYSPRSPELTAGVVFLSAAWIGSSSVPPLIHALRELVAAGFSPERLAPVRLEIGNLQPIGIEILRVLASCWATALVLDLLQVGMIWNPATPLPHEQRLSPISGIMRIIGWSTWERAAAVSIKLTLGLLLLGGLCWWTLGSLGNTGVDSVPEVISKACSVLAVVGGLCLITGLSDAWIRQRRWRTSLEQTEDERRNSR